MSRIRFGRELPHRSDKCWYITGIVFVSWAKFTRQKTLRGSFFRLNPKHPRQSVEHKTSESEEHDAVIDSCKPSIKKAATMVGDLQRYLAQLPTPVSLTATLPGEPKLSHWLQFVEAIVRQAPKRILGTV